MTPEARSHSIKEYALQLGFDACGITDLSDTPHSHALDRWLDGDMAGTMTYMHRQALKRKEPSRILPGGTRAVVVTRGYDNPDPEWQPGWGLVAKYARGADYHDALSGPLESLANHVRSVGGPDARTRCYVDAGPVPERELAQRAGLGWIGKNTMFIDPTRGSFFFIATVLTDVDIAIDLPFEADRCGTCDRCLKACPTDAFPEERVLDSRLCISYLTIEYREEIEPGLAAKMGDWVFGCDDCQTVCPWNVKFSRDAQDQTLEPDRSLATLEIEWLASVSEEQFSDRLGGTAMTRPGRMGMKRNAAIVRRNQRGQLGED